VTVKPAALAGLLGPRVFDNEMAEKNVTPGVVTGLAWTPSGGDILFIEATRMPGKGNLILTGSLGDVMKESAMAALSLVRAQAVRWGVKVDFEKTDFHVHVPAGAVPKDGPSAGVAMLVALYSLVTNRVVPPDTALTGEITLRGKVMPVGGIKEKVLAASRAGIRRIVMPADNRRHLQDVPPEVRKKIQFVFVRKADDVLKLVNSAGKK
jgi:ATP-dependent Lon protease